MSYYTDDDDDDVTIEVGGYRDAVLVRDNRRRTGYSSPRGYDRGHGRRYDRRHDSRSSRGRTVSVVRRGSSSTPVVVREPATEPVVIREPTSEIQPIHGGMGINLGGVSLGTIAGVVLTLGGLGVQLASHFVDKPKPPPEEAELDAVTKYQRSNSDAERKTHIIETVGRALSDLGQLAAFRKSD